MVLAETELLLREDHALALDPPHGFAAERRALSRVAIDDRRALVGVWNDRALVEVRRPCHNGLRIARPEVDRCEQQLVGVGVLRELLDARGPDPVVPPRPLDALHLGAGHMELERQLVDADVDLDVLAQP